MRYRHSSVECRGPRSGRVSLSSRRRTVRSICGRGLAVVARLSVPMTPRAEGARDLRPDSLHHARQGFYRFGVARPLRARTGPVIRRFCHVPRARHGARAKPTGGREAGPAPPRGAGKARERVGRGVPEWHRSRRLLSGPDALEPSALRFFRWRAGGSFRRERLAPGRSGSCSTASDRSRRGSLRRAGGTDRPWYSGRCRQTLAPSRRYRAGRVGTGHECEDEGGRNRRRGF